MTTRIAFVAALFAVTTLSATAFAGDRTVVDKWNWRPNRTQPTPPATQPTPVRVSPTPTLAGGAQVGEPIHCGTDTSVPTPTPTPPAPTLPRVAISPRPIATPRPTVPPSTHPTIPVRWQRVDHDAMSRPAPAKTRRTFFATAEVKAELKRHAARISLLERMKTRAISRTRRATMSRYDRAIYLENQRHRNRMRALERAYFG